MPENKSVEKAISVEVITDWIQKEVEVKQKERLNRYVIITDQLCSNFSIQAFDESPYIIWESKNTGDISGTLTLSIQQDTNEPIILWINDKPASHIKSGTISLTLHHVYKLQLHKQRGTAYKGRFDFQYHYSIPAYNVDFRYKPTCTIAKDAITIKPLTSSLQRSCFSTVHDHACTLDKVAFHISGCANLMFKTVSGGTFVFKWPFEELVTAWLLASNEGKVECEVTSIECEIHVVEDHCDYVTIYLVINLCINMLSVKQTIISILSSSTSPR